MQKPQTIILLLALLIATVAEAQEVRRQLPSTVDTLKVQGYQPAPVSSHEKNAAPAHVQENRQSAQPTPDKGADPLALLPVNQLGQPLPSYHYALTPYLSPLYWGGWYGWPLHQGLNVNLGASVFAQLGKNAWHKGAGFQQNISMMFAQPITDRLSIAIGGYLNNVSWASDSWRDAGISAIVGYRFNEHWEAYLYGQKSLTNNYQLSPATLRTFGAASYPYLMTPLYDMGAIGDRIGAAVKYNFNPSFSIQLSVEERWMPEHRLPAPPAQPRQNIR